MPDVVLVTISVGKDNKGKPVTECTPHTIVLEKGDQIVWTSDVDGHTTEISKCNEQPVLFDNPGPFKAKKGQRTDAVTRADGARGRYIVLSSLEMMERMLVAR